MKAIEKPMWRSLIIGCVLFAIALCVALSTLIFFSFSSWFYGRYNAELAHVLANVESNIDIDDLEQAVKTGKDSERRQELQKFVNTFVDDFGLAYVYIVIPHPDGTITNVCSSTSAEERAEGMEDLPFLETYDDFYTAEEIVPYVDAWDNPEISYFEDSSSNWGDCYTACKQLIGSDGKPFAILCADYFIDDLRAALTTYTLLDVTLIVVAAFAFGAFLVFWLRRNVTKPISALESSARSFMESSRGRKSLSDLHFEAPDIRTKNELASLSDTLVQMSDSMRDYLEDVLSAEQRADDARQEAEGMMRLAYEDSLTHVKSKASYEVYRSRLEEKVAAGNAEFAVVMVDLNGLKAVNDSYGHEHGDEYIIGSCRIICAVFGHSPVFRIGGDEFVILLTGQDFENREELVRAMSEEFAAAQADERRDPWSRYSASSGMATFGEVENDTFEAVFNRADADMYRNKQVRRS